MGLSGLSSCDLNGAPLPRSDDDGVPGTWFVSAASVNVNLPQSSITDVPRLVVCPE